MLSLKNSSIILFILLVFNACQSDKTDKSLFGKWEKQSKDLDASLVENGISFSHRGGFYLHPVLLNMQAENPEWELRYTIDGSEPDANDELYSKPLELQALVKNYSISDIPTTAMEGPWQIKFFKWKEPKNKLDQAVVLRVRAFSEGEAMGDISSQTYFISQKSLHHFPVVSLQTDTTNLYNYYKGIMVPGYVFDTTEWVSGKTPFWAPGNYRQKGKAWERATHIEYFEDWNQVLSADVGIRITGAVLGGFPNKSMRVVARKSYGPSYLNYPFFENRELEKYKRVLLRNSGGDYSSTMFRDAIFQDILSPLNMELQASRPVVCYLNGEYWGIYNLREKMDDHYIRGHFNLKANEFDMVEGCGNAAHGSAKEYKELMLFIKTNDLSKAENYSYVESQIDIESFIHYQIAETYLGNTDWPGNNVKLWKAKDGGKWRWLMFDLDRCFGHKATDQNEPGPDFNMIEWSTVENSPHWYNTDCSTLLFRSLLKNEEFKTRYLYTYTELAKDVLSAQNILKKIDEYEELYRPEIKKHIDRWGYPKSMNEWEKEIEKMRYHATERPKHYRKHLEEFFQINLDDYSFSESE